MNRKQDIGDSTRQRTNESLVTAIADLDEETALRLVRERLELGENPVRILEDARSAMEIIGRRFANGEYSIADLVYSEEILSEVVTRSRSFKDAEVKRYGRCVIGTLASARRDLSKTTVAFMLDVNGFEVYDLGVDVPAYHFVRKVQESGAEIVVLCGFLTSCLEAMRETVEAISAAGLRRGVKIIIYGGQVDERITQYSRADGYATDAMTAVKLAKGWLGVK